MKELVNDDETIVTGEGGDCGDQPSDVSDSSQTFSEQIQQQAIKQNFARTNPAALGRSNGQHLPLLDHALPGRERRIRVLTMVSYPSGNSGSSTPTGAVCPRLIG